MIINLLLHLIPFCFSQLYLYEAVARLMAGANPTETHHLLQRSTLRQRCNHKGYQTEDAGIEGFCHRKLKIYFMNSQ